MEGGFLGLGVHSRAGSTPCLLLPATAILSSLHSSVTASLWVPDPAPRVRSPRRGSGGGGAVSAPCHPVTQQSCPSCAATLPPLPAPSCLAPPAPHGDRLFPLRDSRYYLQLWLVFIPALPFLPFSPTTADTVSATAALPWARTRVRCGDPAQWKGPEGFPRWPGDTRAENVPARSIHSAPAALGKWGGGGEAGSGLGCTGVGAGSPGRFSALFPPSE